MSKKSPLKDKIVLVVDDEPDVLETVGEVLDMCLLYKAKSYEEGVQYLRDYTLDLVILDIMGVNGFELLKRAVEKGVPAVMLTAHALSLEALKKSIKLGAVSFLPKEKMAELQGFLEDVIMGGGKPVWGKLFQQIGTLFEKHFGPDWQERDQFFKEFVEAVKEDS